MARGIEVHNGKVILGDIVEQVIAIDLGMDKTLVGRVNPLLVKVDETRNWYPDDHASTIDGDMYAGWFLVQVGEAPTGPSTILRLESNTKGITLTSFIDFVVSGVPVGDFEALFICHPGATSAWNGSGAVSNTMGYLKIKLGPADRYIQLYGTPP